MAVIGLNYCKVDICPSQLLVSQTERVELILWEARWPSGRASDSGARGRGLILTRVAVLYP